MRLLVLWLTVFLSLGPTTLSAATFYVNANTGNDNRTALQAQDPNTPWETITRATFDPNDPNGPQPGDVIEVAAATYDSFPDPCDPNSNGENFPLQLLDGVHIKGAGSGSTFVEHPVGGPAFENDGTLLSNTTQLSGFTIRDDGVVRGDRVVLVTR